MSESVRLLRHVKDCSPSCRVMFKYRHSELTRTDLDLEPRCGRSVTCAGCLAVWVGTRTHLSRCDNRSRQPA